LPPVFTIGSSALLPRTGVERRSSRFAISTHLREWHQRTDFRVGRSRSFDASVDVTDARKAADFGPRLASEKSVV
jgi:hypothetical protein